MTPRNVLLWACLAMTVTPALAQPAFPPGMLGKPLPTTDIPKDSVTVRVAADAPAYKRVGYQVDLYSLRDGKAQLVGSNKTGKDARALFKNLAAGAYVAVLPTAKPSRRSEVFFVGRAGTRIMLSTKAGILNKPGELTQLAARAAKAPVPQEKPAATTAPQRITKSDGRSGAAEVAYHESRAGFLDVKAQFGDKRPAGGAIVRLDCGDAGKLTQTANGEGEVRFDSKSLKQCLVALEYAGLSYSSEKIALNPARGALVTFRVFAITGDASKLRIGRGTHLMVESGEGGVGVMHVMVVENKSDKIVMDAKKPIAIPLPEGALRAEVLEKSRAYVELDAQKRNLLIKKPLPPGQLPLRVVYELRHEGGTLDLRWNPGLEIDRSLIALDGKTSKLHGPSYGGPSQSEHGGPTKFRLFLINPVKSGQALEVTLSNLPARDLRPRIAVLVVAGLIMLWGAAAAAQGRRRAQARRARRDALLTQLQALDTGELGDEERSRKRAQLVEQLKEVWEV